MDPVYTKTVEGIDLNVAQPLRLSVEALTLDTLSDFSVVPSNGEHGLPAQSWCQCTWHS